MGCLIELRTLGGLAVMVENGFGGEFTRRRPLALLAVLALRAPESVPRDKLLALLWPELDEEHGRNVLNQTLFGIRRALGSPDVVLGRTDLRLNLELVGCDVAGFIAALERGDNRGAASLYAGPFLDGFHVSEAPEFERWVESNRSRLERRAVTALRELAAAAEGDGDHHGAAEALWRITDIDPLDSSAALAVVRSLADAGERARAVRFARQHEALLRDEIGSAVDPAMSDLVLKLLAEGRARSDSVDRASGAQRAPIDSQSREVPPPPVLGYATSPRRRHPRWHVALGAATIALTSVTVLVLAQGRGSSRLRRAEAEPTVTIAVLPFTVHGPSEADYLRAAMVELLGRAFDGAGELRPVDPQSVLRDTVAFDLRGDIGRGAALAGTLEAGEFVLGDVVATGASLRIAASQYERMNGVRLVASASVDGRPEDLLGLVDRLASQLLLSRTGRGRASPTDVAAMSTHSLPALKAFVSAQSHRRAARYAEALEAFQSALREDSTFALAWYGLANVADWATRGDLVLPAASAAVRFSERLTEHDRLLVRAHLAWREERVDTAEELYRRLLHAYPDDAEAWYQFGELLFHGNSRRGRSFAEAREPFERVLALEPEDREALVHITRIALRADDDRAIDSLTARVALATPGPLGVEARTVRAFAMRDSSAQRAALQEIAPLDGTTLAVIAWRVGLYALDFDGAASILRLGTVGRSPALAVHARSALPLVLMGQGRVAEAFAVLDELPRAGGGSEISARITRGLLLLSPNGDVVASQIGPTLASIAAAATTAFAAHTEGDSVSAVNAACVAGLLAARHGQADRAAVFGRQLRTIRGSTALVSQAQYCVSSIHARLLLRKGQTDAALEALLAERRDRLPVAIIESLDRFLIAETLVSLGRPEEAVRWFESIAERGFDEAPLLASAERRLGELAELRGDRLAAVRHLGLYTRLHAHCDAVLRPALLDARRSRRALAALGVVVP